MCDCEGYEKELFTVETIPFLSNTDLLIEMHDIFDASISSTVLPLFSESHKLKIFYSHKPNPGLYNILNSLIGSQNVEKDIRFIFEKYPETLKCIPTLLAVRQNEIYAQDEEGSFSFNFSLSMPMI